MVRSRVLAYGEGLCDQNGRQGRHVLTKGNLFGYGWDG